MNWIEFTKDLLQSGYVEILLAVFFVFLFAFVIRLAIRSADYLVGWLPKSKVRLGTRTESDSDENHKTYKSGLVDVLQIIAMIFVVVVLIPSVIQVWFLHSYFLVLVVCITYLLLSSVGLAFGLVVKIIFCNFKL